MALALACAPALAVNLVTNGSFETGNFSGWTTQSAAQGSGYAVTQAEALVGLWAVSFAGIGLQHDEIRQTLATTAGTTYTISMWVKNYGIENDSLQIGWENGILLDMTPVGTGLESWQFVTVDALATTSGSLLRIRGHDQPAAFYVDDIQVQAVPEPSTLAALGLGALAMWRRKWAKA